MSAKKLFNLLRLFLIIFLFMGCAGPSHIALKPTATKNVSSVDFFIGLSQQEIYAEIAKSQVATAMGGGLIPALIDAAIDQNRAKGSENKVLPIRNSLIDYDFGKCLTEKMEAELRPNSWMKVQNIRIVQDTSKDNYERLLAGATASGALFADTKYFLSPDFKTLTVSSMVKLFLKDNKGANLSEEKILYKNIFLYEEALKNKAASQTEAINAWAENGGMLARQALNSACSDVAKMMAIDLDAGSEKKGEEIFIGPPEGTVVFKSPERTIIRDSRGALRSLRNP